MFYLHRISTIAVFAAALVIPGNSLFGQSTNPETPGVQALAQGPVHEAFAQPIESQPEPSPLVPMQPPQPIPERAPDMRPDGKNVQWIPGYWAWDSEKRDFLWITGTYRNSPDGRQYVPGYWSQSADGWRWVQGYWANASNFPPGDNQAYQPEFLPRPPAALATGPKFEGPADSMYYPGYWSHQNEGYNWRPGLYGRGYAGRIWIPPHYVWTPRGYVFVDGYWDYSFADRGLLFAPVAFSSPLWNDPSWYYSPYYTVNNGLFLDNLFCNGPFFYFGNYFGPRWAGLGYRPWYGGGYNPYFGYYNWFNRGNPGWYAGLHNGYLARGAGTLGIPGRAQLLTPLGSVGNLARVTAAEAGLQRAAAFHSHQLGLQRSRIEAARSTGIASAVHTPTLHAATVTPHISTASHTSVAPHVSVAAHNSVAPHVAHTATVHHATTPAHANTVHHAAPAGHAHAAASHRSGGGHSGGHHR